MTRMIGWAIIHSIWQAGLVAVLTAGLLFLFRGASAATRYRIAVLGLLLVAMLPVATVRWTARDRDASGATASSAQLRFKAPAAAADAKPGKTNANRAVAATSSLEAAAPAPSLRARIERVIPWLVALWLLGVMLFSARTITGYVWARRLVKRGTTQVSDQLRGAAARMADSMGVRVAVRVLESSRVSVPMVVGWLRPVILIPASMLSGLMPQQIEAILAHELAHVRRHDYLVNLLQTVVETLYFYHPAAWWLSGRIREERENACDELAVAACGGDRVFYSRVLLTVEEARADAPLMAVAANGGSLSRRIHRLLGAQQAHLDIGPRWYAGVFTIALAVVTGGGLAEDRFELKREQAFAITQDTAKARPSAVIRSDGAGTLEQRWAWAETQAKKNRYDRYWVGYLLDGDPTGQTWLHYDREVPVTMSESVMMGHIRMQGDFNNVRVPGVALRTVVGEYEPHRVVVLLGFDRGKLARVHLSSFVFPMSFAGAPLLWLGEAADAESIARMATLDAATRSDELHEELAGAVAAHDDAQAAVSVLERWALDAGRSARVRAEAVEGLEHFSSPRVLSLLARIARTDRDEHVRGEAVEAIGGLDELASLDTLLTFARTVDNEHVQLEAIEALADLQNPRGLDALRALVDDRSLTSRLRAEALESIANRTDSPQALELLKKYASESDDQRVQVEAVEALANANADAAARINALVDLTNRHADVYIQGRAAEALGNVDSDAAISELEKIVRTHPNADVRRRGLEALGNFSDDDRAGKILLSLARSSDEDTQRRAVEALGDFHEHAIFEEVANLARSNAPIDVRRMAVETYMSNASPAAAIAFARRMLASDAPFDVRREVLESLESVDDGAGVPLLIEIARETNDQEIRRRVIEALIDSDDPRAIEALKKVR